MNKRDKAPRKVLVLLPITPNGQIQPRGNDNNAIEGDLWLCESLWPV